MQHHFDITIATNYGVNEAILLNNIAFWLAHNKANNKHFYENRYWTYNSVKAFLELFPYWTTRNLRTIIESCIKQNLLIKGDFNKNSYNKTGWYTLTDQGLALFPALSICQKRQMSNDAGCEGKKALEPAPLPICQKRQMDLSETTNGFVRNDKSITDINIDNKTTDKKVIIEIPLWLSKEVWKEFKQHRKDLKKPLTSLAEKKALNVLENLREQGHNPVEVITTSIVNGWTGLFPIKKQPTCNGFTKEEPKRPTMRDFTQERLDREYQKLHN